MSRWGREDDDRDAKDQASPSDRDNFGLDPKDYLAAARQFRYREQYEEFLVKEWGLERDSKEWEKAQRDWELKEHLQDQERHPKRGVRQDANDRRELQRDREQFLKAARESNTREEFDKFLREVRNYKPGSEEYEQAMLAWAIYKREKEGF